MSPLSNKNSVWDREYLISIKAEYNLLEQKYISVRKELKKWEGRITLAEKNGKTYLKREAEGQAELIRNDISYLTDQLMGLKTEVEKTVSEIQKQPQQMSIDPNKLLADMKNLIGENNTLELEKEINEINADYELARLKKEMEK